MPSATQPFCETCNTWLLDTTAEAHIDANQTHVLGEKRRYVPSLEEKDEITGGSTAPPASLNAAQAGTSIKELLAPHLDFPVNADWPISALAEGGIDDVDAAIKVLLFDDTAEEGCAFAMRPPADATGFTIRFRTRAIATPGGAVAAAMKLYARGTPDDDVPSTWANVQLTDLAYAANLNWQYDEQTVTLASLSLTAGEECEFELTRDAGHVNDDLVSDLVLRKIEIEWY